jgi:endonuclease/exonuclease/phosphatase family metal-dependent hydrolase
MNTIALKRATNHLLIGLTVLAIVILMLPDAQFRAQTETPTAAPALAPVELRVMTFNIWVGGELVDLGKVIEAIRAAQADVVGLQEIGGNIGRIAAGLGWQYMNPRLGIIARYPLIDLRSGDGTAIFVQVNPGQVIAIANTHLSSDPYGPYLVRDGEPLDKVLANEQALRMPEMEPVVAGLGTLIDAGIPVVLTGDFNSPSHLDWTEAGAKIGRTKRYPVAWPVSLAAAAHGLQDTYRAAHPDVVAKPGITWPAGYPAPRVRDNEAYDRIDFVYASKGIQVIDSKIVGEPGGADVDIPISPYPSDHRAVVSTLKVTPVVPPLFVSFDKNRVTVGETIVVRYHAPIGETTDRIVIVRAGGDAVKDGLISLPPYEADFFGAATFGSGTLTPGKYDAVLITEGNKEVARNSVWVVAPDAKMTVSTDKTTYTPDDAITVTWANGPGNRADWIGIYAASETNPYNYLGFLYTGGEVSGSVTFKVGTLGSDKLAPGTYTAALMLDDGYAILAGAPFTVAP